MAGPNNEDWKEFGEFKQKLLAIAAAQSTHEAVCSERWKAVNEKMKWGFLIIGFLVVIQLGAEKAEVFLRMTGAVGGNVAEIIKPVSK